MERFEISGEALSPALHSTAGIVLTFVGIVLIPTTLEADLPWVVLTMFLAGSFLSIGLDRFADLVAIQTGGEANAGEECAPREVDMLPHVHYASVNGHAYSPRTCRGII